MNSQFVYIVNRLHWEYTDEWYAVDGDSPVRAFTTRQEAEAHCLGLEAERRREVSESSNPHSFFNPYLPDMICTPLFEVVEVELEE